MSSTQCNYFHCFNRKKKEKHLSFFSFPVKDRKQFKLWRKYCGNPELAGKGEEDLKCALICEKHFKDKDIIMRDKRKLLQPHAIPIPWKAAEVKQEKVEIKKEKSLKSAGSPKPFGDSKKEKIKIKTEPKSRHKQIEVVVEPRTGSKRAASKRALSQMQVLLEDEADTVEIPDDDDDVIPILDRLNPPKKKYKVSHRKSSEGGEIIVLKNVSKPQHQQERLPSITNHYVENNLELECWNEDLEPCQIERNQQLAKEEEEIQKKLDELVQSCKGEVIYQGNLTTLIEIGEQIQKTIQSTQAAAQAVVAAQAAQQQQLILNSQVATSGYQLMVDPRLGLVAIPPSGGQQKQIGSVKVAQNLTATPSPSSRNRARGGRTQKPAAPSPPPLVARTPVSKQTGKRVTVQPSINLTPATRSTRASGGAAPSSGFTENNVVGGLATGPGAMKPKAFVDLTTDDGKPLPDSREVSFNKLQGKTYPSLVVVARPHMRVTDVNIDRPKLDAKVKSALMFQPTKFTEWLIQQGLVKAEQRCSTHNNQLKLGMYSDVSKFPYSGGYVWISDCCPQRFVSVFSGSIFEGSPHPPLTILKLLYHWSCQTNVQNVVQWVKVDNLYVKGMYTWLRSICTTALQTHVRQLGGPGQKVEVGVISLGTTSQDGNSRQVKVEVLGIMELHTKLIRLRAIEPLADGDRNYRKRFAKILEPLVQWVNPQTTILTDMTVDKSTLNHMGFAHVVQAAANDGNSNRTIMEYLRKIVPRMFQNTLSLLSRQIIQQFLDELVWREWFGITSMEAFDNLVSHLSEQTRHESGQNLIIRLNRVAQNPFKNWSLPGVTSQTSQKAVLDAGSKKPITRKRGKEIELPKTMSPAPKSAPTPKPGPASKAAPKPGTDSSRPPKPTSPDVPEQMVPLENYYYGTIDNYPPRTTVLLDIKCPFCKDTFSNNLMLMGHLFKHAHNVQDGEMCRYCLTSTTTANDLVKHIATSHPQETKFDNGFMCLICETTFMNPFILGKHMSKDHSPMELPYQCGTCGYRCSNHKQAIDHFYKQHDSGPTIQCPFCLKSTTVFSASRNIAQNIHFFVQHLQKHQRKQIAKRCGKCSLWFVQKDILKDHQTKMHASQRGKLGLVPWPAPRNGVMVPKSKMDKFPCDGENINFEKLVVDIPGNMICKECNTTLNNPKHFPSFEYCHKQNCQYATCCSKAMEEHNEKCAKNAIKDYYEEKLPYKMYCVCGFTSEDGNRLAEHLAICERKSAYPSLAESKTASVTHSMLDILGLVRKPEETEKKYKKSKTDLESVDSPVVLDDDSTSDEIKMDTDDSTSKALEEEDKTEPGKEEEGAVKEIVTAETDKTETTEHADKPETMDIDEIETVDTTTEDVGEKTDTEIADNTTNKVSDSDSEVNQKDSEEQPKSVGETLDVEESASPITIDDESRGAAESTDNVQKETLELDSSKPEDSHVQPEEKDEIVFEAEAETVESSDEAIGKSCLDENSTVSPKTADEDDEEKSENNEVVVATTESIEAKQEAEPVESGHEFDNTESKETDLESEDASGTVTETVSDSIDPEPLITDEPVKNLLSSADAEEQETKIEEQEDVVDTTPISDDISEDTSNTEAVTSTVEDKELTSSLEMEDISPGNFESGSLDAYVTDETEMMDTADIPLPPPRNDNVSDAMRSDNAMETEAFYNDIE